LSGFLPSAKAFRYFCCPRAVFTFRAVLATLFL
jgi:hypothetical protein